MPASFDKCVSEGGRVRTVSGVDSKFGLKADEYIHICFDGKEMHRGEVKKKDKVRRAA